MALENLKTYISEELREYVLALKEKVATGKMEDTMALHKLRQKLPNYSLSIAKRLWADD